MRYADMTSEELKTLKDGLRHEYDEFAAEGHSLNMARGKPSPEQLDLSLGLLDTVSSETDFSSAASVDVRNYGVLDGLPAAKKLMAAVLGVPPENTIVLGNSSLTIMYDLISHAMTHGILGSTPWCKLENVRFLCPAPGYDRHFSICEHFGIDMVTIPMTETGPDMDMVERLAAEDSSIKGIWCVPQYSNPQGVVYSDETVERLANLKVAAEDFRIFWDNAYVIHHLYDEHPTVANIKEACDAAENPDIFYEFASLSKVTFAGSAIAAVASSDVNIASMEEFMFFSMIGPDKLNQLRHVLYFAEEGSLKAHMSKQAEILRPRFELVISTLERELGDAGIGTWTNPKGGYFISFDALPGCAKRIVALAGNAGVKMTGAGATYPYKLDPQDSNIRIAPTYPSMDDLSQAVAFFTICVKLASIEKIVADRG